MKKYVIITDSCSDLEKSLRDEYDILYVPNYLTFNGKNVPASLDWEDISAHDYYEMMKGGTRVITSQVNEQSYKQMFEEYINKGYDILSLSCSSALSNSVKTSYMVRDELKAKYPDAKIICIDTLAACYGLGIICIQASKLRKEGKTIDEVADWVEEHKLEAQQYGTVNDLKFLKWSGRVTATAALFGTLLNIKPIIMSDAKGQNVSIEKVKGRKNSLDRMIALFKEKYVDVDYQNICIGHAECLEDAESLKAEILKFLPNANVHIGYIGPVVGASVGPSMIAIYFFGEKTTYKVEK